MAAIIAGMSQISGFEIEPDILVECLKEDFILVSVKNFIIFFLRLLRIRP